MKGWFPQTQIADSASRPDGTRLNPNFNVNTLIALLCLSFYIIFPTSLFPILREVGCWFFVQRIVNVVSVMKRRLFEDMPMISRWMHANERVVWGGFFIIFGSTFFGGFLYTAVISKLLPCSDNAVFLAIQNDRYYCFLVPLTLPVLVVAVSFYWLSMKIFKHAWPPGRVWVCYI